MWRRFAPVVGAVVALALTILVGAGARPARASVSMAEFGPVCAPAPANKDNLVYLLADHSRIYVSKGGGGAWQPVSTGLPASVGVYAMGLDSVSSDVLYAGTTGQGIYKTFTSGSYWFNASDESIATTYVYAMTVDPTNNRRVYAGGDNAVYRSVDGGLTWEQGNIGLPSFLVYSMALDPQNPNVVYVGTDGSGVYRGDATFSHWTFAGAGLPAASPVLALVADPAAAGVLYAGTAVGLFRTTNAGISWQPVGDLPVGQPASTVALAGRGSRTLYAGTARGLYRSLDGGAHWTPVQGEVGTAPISALALDPRNPRGVYAASRGALWRSTDGGTAWAVVNKGMPVANISTVAVFNPARTPVSPCLPPAGSGPWQYVAATGHTIAGPFLSYYQKNGGAAILGMPRTEAIQDPGVGATQYFENARLDLKDGQVVVADLGSLLTTSRQPFPTAPPSTGNAAHPFSRLASHNISDIFLRFWRRHGGAAILGLPISEEVHEVNDDGTGAEYQLQFFSKARLEYHPELHGSAVVQLGKLGNDLLRSRGWL